MKKPTQDLYEEHGGIILMLKIMGKIAEKLKKGEEVKKEHLSRIVEFLRNFADKCHHGKEEGILFPVAEKELSKELQAHIEKRFEKLERDVIGIGKHEEYHGWLKEL